MFCYKTISPLKSLYIADFTQQKLRLYLFFNTKKVLYNLQCYKKVI